MLPLPRPHNLPLQLRSPPVPPLPLKRPLPNVGQHDLARVVVLTTIVGVVMLMIFPRLFCVDEEMSLKS
jgi:hypothetical protein